MAKLVMKTCLRLVIALVVSVQVAGLEVISSGAAQETSADLSLDQEGLIPVTKTTKLTTATTMSPLPRNDSRDAKLNKTVLKLISQITTVSNNTKQAIKLKVSQNVGVLNDIIEGEQLLPVKPDFSQVSYSDVHKESTTVTPTSNQDDSTNSNTFKSSKLKLSHPVIKSETDQELENEQFIPVKPTFRQTSSKSATPSQSSETKVKKPQPKEQNNSKISNAKSLKFNKISTEEQVSSNQKVSEIQTTERKSDDSQLFNVVDHLSFDDVDDCLETDDSLDCYMLREGLVAGLEEDGVEVWRHDQALKRARRQSDPTGEAGSGTDAVLPPTIEQVKTFNVTSQIELMLPSGTTPGGPPSLNGTQKQLEEIFKSSVHNSSEVAVTGVTLNQTTGNYIVDYTLTVTDVPTDPNSDSLFALGTKQEFTDELNNRLTNANESYFDTFKVGDLVPAGPLPVQTITDDVIGDMENLCATPCPSGYGFCVPSTTEFGAATCQSNCEILEAVQQCQHGSTCSLDAGDEAFCDCGDSWEGRYCESRKALDTGEITGIALGGAAALAGILGLAAWLACCRRSRKALSYTHYSDDLDSVDNFSNPSSKLSNYAIQRPTISNDPLPIFNTGPRLPATAPPFSMA